jgi:hypothetical protein
MTTFGSPSSMIDYHSTTTSVSSSAEVNVVKNAAPLAVPYQIAWSYQETGKWISRTKRCVQFRYGYASKKAIHNSLSGVDCHHSDEHEATLLEVRDITLIWSIISKKRRVIVDGQEIPDSRILLCQVTKFRCDVTFSMPTTQRYQDVIQLIAHDTTTYPPVSLLWSTLRTKPKNDCRPFDMLLNGCSFFQFPHYYEIDQPSSPAIPMTTPETKEYDREHNVTSTTYNTNHDTTGRRSGDVLVNRLSSYDSSSIYHSDSDHDLWDVESEDYSYRHIGRQKQRDIVESCHSF